MCVAHGSHCADDRLTARKLGERLVAAGFVNHVGGGSRVVFKDAAKSWYQCVSLIAPTVLAVAALVLQQPLTCDVTRACMCLCRFPCLDQPLTPRASVIELAQQGRFDEIECLPQFLDFTLNVWELRRVHPQRMEDGAMKLAFWLNLHNLLVRPPTRHMHPSMPVPVAVPMPADVAASVALPSCLTRCLPPPRIHHRRPSSTCTRA